MLLLEGLDFTYQSDGRWEGLLKWAEEFQKNFQSFGYDAIR